MSPYLVFPFPYIIHCVQLFPNSLQEKPLYMVYPLLHGLKSYRFISKEENILHVYRNLIFLCISLQVLFHFCI